MAQLHTSVDAFAGIIGDGIGRLLPTEERVVRDEIHMVVNYCVYIDKANC